MISHGSLCTGYGGIDLALTEVLGAETAWVSDVDKGANKVLDHRFPGVPNIGDMTAVDWSTVEPVDVLSGGTPCPDLSHAGKRAGMTEGTRSNLWVTMREGIAYLRPQYVIWENVRGAYSAAADSEVEPCPGCVGDRPGVSLRALHRVLGDLSGLGYDCRWHGLRAADVGAPHGRFRVFVVAQSQDIGHERRWAPRGRWAGPADRDRGVVALLPTPAVNDMGAGKTVDNWDEWTAKMKAKHGNGNGHGPSLAIEAQRSVQQWGKYADAIAQWEHLTRAAPAPTEPGRNGNPRLSPAFTEWLMGLPAGWITDVPGVTRNEALKLCGNGVVPQQADAALRFLLDVQEVAA